MLELYVVLTLSAIGYLLNSMNNTVKPKKNEINKLETPSMSNIYHSKYATKTNEMEKAMATKAYKAALKPKETNRIMSLSGELVDTEKFTHNNMEPYFGGSIKQNMDINRNQVLLENFTGVTNAPSKCEVKSFYDQSKDLGNVFGVSNNNQFYKDRLSEPIRRNNEVPITQVQVGPGLNKGYTADPDGGFQQFDVGEVARTSEKCVDELRVKSKPKQTYGGRKVDGMKGKMRGEEGKVEKNRVERYFEQTEDMLLKTTGAVLKEGKNGEFNVKNTNRQNTSKEYKGTAKGSNKNVLNPDVRPSEKPQVKEQSVRNAVMTALGLGTKDDYGKKDIVVYNNERDLTTTKTYEGNITSLIKAIVAPIEDLIKPSKKEEYVDNPRHFGNLGPQTEKHTIRTDEPARTTVKETTLDEVEIGNFKGSQKITIYNDDEAKTTVKETTLDEVELGNLKGSQKLTVYNEDEARTTTKETMLDENELGNLKGPQRITIWDANDVARTTIAETLLHDEMGTGAITGPKEIYVYDPDEHAKTTIRETMDFIDYTTNFAPTHKRQKLHLEDDIRTTMKETLIDNKYEGQVEAMQKSNKAYLVTDYEAPTTQKQFLSDLDHFGQAGRDLGEGYITNEMEAPLTQKQFLSDIDYYGGGDGVKQQVSYDNYGNARITERKEVLEFDREPTAQGAKQANCNINMRINKQECKTERKQHNMDHIYQVPPELSDRTITKQRLAVDIDSRMGLDRIDPDLLNAYRSNPYARKLGDIA